MLKVEIQDNILFFLNIYAPNNGQERLQFFTHLKDVLRQGSGEGCVIMGGDWKDVLRQCSGEGCVIRGGDWKDVLRQCSGEGCVIKVELYSRFYS